MENNDSNITIRCNNCNAEVSEGTKFCTECGTPIETVEIISENYESPSDQNFVCTKCHAEIYPGSNFCKECGTSISMLNDVEHEVSQKIVICPNCNAEVETGLKYCTECGKRIGHNGLSKGKNSNWIDKSFTTISKSSKSIIKDVDALLINTASSIDKSINKSGEPPRVKNEKFKPVRIKEIDPSNKGYLICDECGGVYELKACEKVDDFSDKCRCGGNITFLKKLPNVN